MKSNGSMTRYSSPLRYPGGKGKVANFIKLLLIENSLCGVDYIEPYAGGASVALSLLFDGYVSRVRINDLNKGVHSFWVSALSDPDAFCSKIMTIPLTLEEWQRQKSIHSDADASVEDLGFATFYLNRTNRSGIVSRGGVIGGNEQKGQWGIDARFNREALCERIKKLSNYKSKISVTKTDAAKLIQSVSKGRGEKFLYLDPPYYVKGARLYDNFYTHEDHVKICSAVQALKCPWVVSYDAAPEILKMYAKSRSIRYTLGYSASKVMQGTEVMFFSEGMQLPKVASPAGIRTQEVQGVRRDAMALFD